MARLPRRPLGPVRDGSGSCERARCFQDSADTTRCQSLELELRFGVDWAELHPARQIGSCSLGPGRSNVSGRVVA